LIIGLPALMAFIFVLPHGWGLDEQVHVARAYQLSEGNIYPDRISEKSYGGQIPVSLVRLLEFGHSESNTVDRTSQFFARKDIRHPDIQAALEGAKIDQDNKTTYDFGPTGPYAPVVYAPAALGIAIGRVMDVPIGATLTLAKIVQAFFYLLLCYISIYILRNYKLKWIVFMLALLPASIFQAATINADVVTIAGSFLFLAAVLSLFMDKKKASVRMLALVAGASILLSMTKPSYAIFLLIIPFIPTSVFSTAKVAWVYKSAVLAVALIVLGLVSLKGLAYSDTILAYRDAATAANISLGRQIVWTLTHPLDFLVILAESTIVNMYEWQTSFIGLLGYNTIAAPNPLQAIVLFSLFIAVLYVEKIPKVAAYLFVGLGIISLLSIIFLLYGTFNPVGSTSIIGVQGRYFIPSMAFVMIGFAGLVRLRMDTNKTNVPAILISISAASLYAMLIFYIVALY